MRNIYLPNIVLRMLIEPKISVKKPHFRLKNFALKKLPVEELPYYKNCYLNIGLNYQADENGVIVWRKKERNIYCPTQVAQLGYNELFRYLKNKKEKHLTKALKCAETILKQSVRFDNSLFFKHEYNFSLHGNIRERMKKPWFSAMTQGQALSLFVRLNYFSKEKKYLQLAEQIFNSFSFYKEEKKPWISYINKEGYLWFEEYPTEIPENALNGFIFAIFGLYDYYWLTGSKKAEILIQAALTTLWQYLPSYRHKGGMSFYCLKHKKQSQEYHKIHIAQLKMLYKITKEKYFQQMADNFYRDCH